MVSAFVGLLTLSLAAAAAPGLALMTIRRHLYGSRQTRQMPIAKPSIASIATIYQPRNSKMSPLKTLWRRLIITARTQISWPLATMAIRPHKPMAPYGRQPKPKPVISIQIAIAPSLRLAVVTRLRKPITAPSAAQVVARRPLRRVSAAMMIT